MAKHCPHCNGIVGKGELIERAAKVRKAKPLRLLTTPVPERAANSRIWKAMRMLPTYTLDTLRVTTECGRGSVQDMNTALVKVGYVRLVQAHQPGVPGMHAIYKLIRNTGPLAPRLRDVSIFDVNLQVEVTREH